MSPNSKPTREDEDRLISLYVEDKPYRSGATDAYLKESGVSVWAVVGYWRAVGKNVATTSGDYDLPEEAVEAALAYYGRHKQEIDARIAANAS